MKRVVDKSLTSCWSLKNPLYIDKKDKRYSEHAKKLKEYGFSDTETWGLNSVIAEFILPRLKRFKEVNNGYPYGTSIEQWNAIIDKMIFAFDWELNCNDVKFDSLSQDEIENNWVRYDEGINCFAKYFRQLWW